MMGNIAIRRPFEYKKFCFASGMRTRRCFNVAIQLLTTEHAGNKISSNTDSSDLSSDQEALAKAIGEVERWMKHLKTQQQTQTQRLKEAKKLTLLD
ncbi:hypothetical protein CH63R_03991 [Colletotrichum higginsianum IMI 349063]|uniref:Uncharacterized protein n=1 Tax=Colletotrichum higginsianum (strain IMI 349063) TaxID=759273 RepID=A0A1B7YI57_COLHI|nr:hypothetical protein CH63R_03991 [Colletotrichum higginsianum IMI 349063]OBR11695.1 hypothetical protein CH63R_03991 [Colletotrichum higginsianum IMI 349063]